MDRTARDQLTLSATGRLVTLLVQFSWCAVNKPYVHHSERGVNGRKRKRCTKAWCWRQRRLHTVISHAAHSLGDSKLGHTHTGPLNSGWFRVTNDEHSLTLLLSAHHTCSELLVSHQQNFVNPNNSVSTQMTGGVWRSARLKIQCDEDCYQSCFY